MISSYCVISKIGLVVAEIEIFGGLFGNYVKL